MLSECHYQQFVKGATPDCAHYFHILPLNDTPIPMRQYKLFDNAGKSEACYQPGTLWCTSWSNADKTFASRTT